MEKSSLDPKASLAAWIGYQQRQLFPLTFEKALLDLASRQRRSRHRKDHCPFATETFVRSLAKLKDDASLRAWVLDSGEVRTAMRVWVALTELRSWLGKADAKEFETINNRLYLNPSALDAVRIAFELASDD
jgi:hypothetical protein